MQPRTPLMGIEASTTGVKVVLAGFDLFPSLLKKLLVEKGIVAPGPAGKLKLLEDHWFPLDSWLAVYDAIYAQIGPNALFTLGTHILENPKFPSWVRDIDTALQSIDIAYHRSHRRNGVLMYDQSSGQMLEGIGHYRSHHVQGQRCIEVVCDDPYPCEVDQGIVTQMARQFEPKARITHGADQCRRKGATTCTYLVKW